MVQNHRDSAGLPDRHLSWPHCYNARDLGGLPTEDGKETCRRAVIRSDIANRLTQEGRQALIDYGVRTIIDLRSPQETAEEPSLFAGDARLAYLNLPLVRGEPHAGILIEQAQTREEEYCIIVDYHADAVAAVMRAILGAEPGGILIHCHAGKDRTGIVVALLLRLAGVPAEVVAADYAQSQQRLWPLYEKIVEEAGGEDKAGSWLKPTATEEMMAHMLAHLDTDYGGVAAYLSAAGLTAGEMARLKERLCAGQGDGPFSIS